MEEEDKAFFETDTAQERFESAVDRAAKEYGKKNNTRVCIDEVVLLEIFDYSRRTLTYHVTKKPNHYKVAGHIAYWIRKLKPFSVEPMNQEAINLSRLAKEIFRPSPDDDQSFFNDIKNVFSSRQILDEDYVRQIADYNKKLCTVNEDLALSISMRIFLYYEKKQQKSNFKSRKYKSKIKSSRKMLVNSFRKHNYSARSMATAFEWALS